MNIDNLIKDSTGQVSLSLTPGDLQVFARQVAEQVAESQKTPERQQDNSDQLLRADEVCERLAVTRQTLHKWKVKGWLVPVKIGYAVRWREQDVKEIAERGMV